MKEQYQLDSSLDQYINKLITYGVILNKKLKPAIFRLKNGLPYPGLLTDQKVDGKEELVKIPLDLVLTSHKAMKDPELSDVFSNTFYKQGSLWQDRILVTYILHLLSTNRSCIWTYMAQQFSKDIDIISFWPSSQLEYFIDKSVRKAANKQRQHFQQQWSRFEEIKSQYNILESNDWFSKQNYKWIYIHTISRCFGSFLNSTYFVPYCELFNHNNVDVSYSCVTQASSKCNQQNSEQAQQTAIESLSISSGYSQDYLSDDDFDYMSINSYIIKWCSKISYDLKDKEVKIIDKQLAEIYDWMDSELDWRGFTLIYLGQIIQKFKILENQYKAGRKKFNHTTEKIEETKLHVFAYRKYLVEFYRSQGREYQKIKNQRGVECHNVKDTSRTNYDKKKQQYRQPYTHFKMQSCENAHFETKSQIYFSYGKLSNRTLLVRYGFCIENNHYEHVWVKYSMRKNIEPYPDLFQQIQNKCLSVNYKMKLKNYTLSMQPILIRRMEKWKLTHHCLQDIYFITDVDRELQTIEGVKQFYLKCYEDYANLDDDLTVKSLTYHEYFAKVYNVQKKKIVEYQLQLLEYIKNILNLIKLQKVSIKEGQIQKKYQKPLRYYLKGLRALSKI